MSSENQDRPDAQAGLNTPLGEPPVGSAESIGRERLRRRFSDLLALPGWAEFEQQLEMGLSCGALARAIRAHGHLRNKTEDAVRKRLVAYFRATNRLKPTAGRPGKPTVVISDRPLNLVFWDQLVRADLTLKGGQGEYRVQFSRDKGGGHEP